MLSAASSAPRMSTWHTGAQQILSGKQIDLKEPSYPQDGGTPATLFSMPIRRHVGDTEPHADKHPAIHKTPPALRPSQHRVTAPSDTRSGTHTSHGPHSVGSVETSRGSCSEWRGPGSVRASDNGSAFATHRGLRGDILGVLLLSCIHRRRLQNSNFVIMCELSRCQWARWQGWGWGGEA